LKAFGFLFEREKTVTEVKNNFDFNMKSFYFLNLMFSKKGALKRRKFL